MSAFCQKADIQGELSEISPAIFEAIHKQLLEEDDQLFSMGTGPYPEQEMDNPPSLMAFWSPSCPQVN
ncbi:hypothetical protein ACQZV8_06270 [Magnetococcales bacterium HHB-1]